MKLKTLIVHPKGSVITLPGAEYRPETQPDGEQVFEVNDPAHIERLLAIKEGFAEYAPGKAAAVKKAADKPADDPKPPVEVGLIGSSVHPATFEIGGQTFQLRTIVAMAHTASGLSPTDWNALTDEERHDRLDAELDRLQAEIDAKERAKDQAKPDAPAGGLPDFATMKAPELMAYAGEHLPDATINPKTPLTTLRKLIHKLATAKATAAAPAA
jgi:hypothetical protein